MTNSRWKLRDEYKQKVAEGTGLRDVAAILGQNRPLLLFVQHLLAQEALFRPAVKG